MFNTRKIIFACLLGATGLIALNACDQIKSTYTEKAETKDSTKWVALFNGKNLSGWHLYGKKDTGTAWKAEDSTLHLNAAKKKGWQTKGGGDLITDKEFENFHLKLDWKISKGGNSGIMLYVTDDPAKYEYSWYTGLEMQVADNKFNEDGKVEKHHAGDIYDLIASSPETVKPYSEWNKVEIISINGDLTFFLNGTQILHTTLWDEHWKSLVAASKFRSMPGFVASRKGHIALQDHGADVWYRNVMIKEL